MRRCRMDRRGWACAAAIFVALTGVGTRVAHAQDRTEAQAEAARAFASLRAAHPERMPRLADAEAGPVLHALADPGALGSDDLAAVSRVCGRAREAALAYVSFGVEQGAQPAAVRAADNAAAYQDELALLQPFLAHCIARQVPLAEATLRQLDPELVGLLRLGGLRRGQAGVLQLYASLASAVGDARFGRAYVDALLGALAEAAPAHARALAVDARAVPRDLAAGQLAVAQGERKSAWQKVLDAMSDTRCEALCELAARNGSR
ncbi:MAG: hypothetical protein QM586_11605 [Xenophilus sp.]